MALPALPTDWGSYDAARKVKWFNDNVVTIDDLVAAGIPRTDLDWMIQNGLQPLYQFFSIKWNPNASLAEKQGYIKTVLDQGITSDAIKARIGDLDPANATQEVYDLLGIPKVSGPTQQEIDAAWFYDSEAKIWENFITGEASSTKPAALSTTQTTTAPPATTTVTTTPPPTISTQPVDDGDITGVKPREISETTKNAIDYLVAMKPGLGEGLYSADGTRHTSTFVKTFKNVDGKVIAQDITPEDVASGSFIAYIGQKTGGENRERAAQAYLVKNGQFTPIGDTKYYQGAKDNDFWTDFLIQGVIPMVMAAVPGLGQAVGAAFGATGAAATALGSGIINFGAQLIAGADPLAALKNAVKSAGAGYIGQSIGSMLPAELQSVGRVAITQLVATGKIDLASLAAAAGQQYAATELANQTGMSVDTAKSVIGAGINALGGNELAAIQMLGNAAISGAVDALAGEKGFDPKEKALLQLGASQIIQIAKTGQFNPVSLVNQLTSLGFNQAQASKITGEATPDSAKSNTAIGAVAVDKNGELYTVDDDGNRLMLSGNSAGRVYTPEEWTSIQTALSAGQAQYVNGLINAMNNGTIKPEDVTSDLKNAGYSDAKVAEIFAANQQFVDRAKNTQQVVTDYTQVGSDLSREGALERLKSLGYDDADANAYLSNIDKQVTARNNYVNVSRDYINGSASESQLQSAMDAAGLSGDKADNTLLTLRAIREGGNLTSSELTNAAVANLNQWFNIGGGRQVVFKTNTEDGGLYVASARDASGKDVTNDFYGLNPQGLKNFIEAQQVIQKTAPTIKAGEASVPQELASQGSNLGLGGQTGLIKNNFATVQKSYFDNLLRAYSAMSPEDRAKIATASGATTDMKILKDIDAQYKSIDQQRQTALNNNQKTIADFLLAADTRVENKASHYYLTKGVQPSTAMGLALEDIQAGNLYNRINLSEAKDSTFPFETQQFINQFRGTPAGDTLANVLSTAYAVAGSAAANTLNGALGINLHIAEALGMDTFANDFRKLAAGIKTAGDDAITIANASTDAHKNLIGGLSNAVSAIPWLATGLVPGLVAGAMATTYGNEYIQGRLAGQSIEDAGKRATLMAIAEGIGERIGADELVGLLKPLWRGTSTDQLGKVIGESLINQIGKYGTKEQLGELLSYSLQAGIDKSPQIGLAQNMTGMDFLKGALDTLQQTFVAAGANSGLAVGLRGNMTADNSGSIKVISPDGSQGLVELGNGSVIRVDLPENLGLQVGEQVNVNALQNDVVYVPDDVNEKFSNLQQQVNNAYLNELNRAPTFEELDFNVKRLANGATLDSVITELNNTPQGKLLDDQRAFTSQTDAQIASNAKALLDQGKTTYADFKTFMDSMGLASDRQLNVLDTITPRSTVAGTVTSIVGDNAIVTGTNGQMYTMLRVGPNNYLMQVGDQVNLGVSTVKPTATPTVEVTTKIADVIAASVSKSTSVSLSQSVSEAAVSTSISKSQSLSVSYSQSESISKSTSVSVSESQSKSVSLSQSVSTADMEKSISVSKSLSISTSTSLSQSTSTSLSQSVSASTSTSQSLSTSVSKAVSISEALSLSASVSEQIEKDRLAGLSISASVSESISKAVSISESISKAVSVSESTSTSISTSQSVSKATSISQSLSASVSQSESVSKATSISASVSASTSASLSASTSQSISLSQEVSKQVSISQSTSQSIALSQSLSQSQAVSISASVSESVSKSTSTSLSLSQSTSAALSASVSQSLSLSQKMSEDVMTGISISASLSASQSVSQSISKLVSASLSASQSTSASLSLSLSVFEDASTSQSLSQAQSVTITPSVTQTATPTVTSTVAPTVTQSITQSISESITQSLTESLTLSLTPSVTQLPTIAPTVTASVTPAPTVTTTPTVSVTETFTQTPSLTMVITTTSLPPVTTTITIPPVTTTEPVTTEQVTTITIPPVTPPPTSGTIPPVTTPTISIPEQTTTAPLTTLPVTTAPITTAPVTTAATTSKPPTTTAKPGGLPFPLFGIPAATGQQKTYVDYAQPNVPAPEFGPYDLFKAPSYLRPLQDTGNFGLAALLGAANAKQSGNGDNQSQQNAEGQGQAPKG